MPMRRTIGLVTPRNAPARLPLASRPPQNPLSVGYPAEEEYHEILRRTAGEAMPGARAVATGAEVLEMRRVLRQVPVPEQVQTYAIRLMMATQPGSPRAPEAVNRYVSLGSSPRGAQALLFVGKFHALLDGRFAVSREDVRKAAPSVLRHRVLINFEGQSSRVTPDRVVEEALRAVPELSR